MATGAAIAQTSQSEAATGALPWPVSASVAHLKVKGTAMVASLAASSSTMAPSTRSLRSRAVGRPDIGPQMDHGREQRAAVGGDRRRFGCPVMVVMVAHSGPSYRRILGGNHPASGGIAADR